jgi:hypothetical protein
MAVVRADVSEEHIASIIRMDRISEVGSFHADNGGDTFLRNVSLTRVTKHHNPEGGILHTNRRENLKSYKYEAGYQVSGPSSELGNSNHSAMTFGTECGYAHDVTL